MKHTNGKTRRTPARFLALFLAAALLMALPAAAYDRQEATVASGGTEVTVYKGTRNSNDQGNYLADPGDYLAYNRYQTAGSLSSTSNITSSTNFEKTITPDTVIAHGGVAGVSWDGKNTLTLNNAKGTVITIEGPEIDVASLNTYNSNLSPVIDYSMPNLTYFQQFDLFTPPDGSAGAPHTKNNATEQDVVYINIVGANSFHNIRLSGNVKVVFTGTGTLTLDINDGQNWNYDDYSEPGFDVLSHPGSSAVASYPTIGHKGSLKGEDAVGSTMPNGMVRTITEDYEYALPEIVLQDVGILEGGTVCNTAQVKEDYFTFTGTTAPNDESRLSDTPADAVNPYLLNAGGVFYNMVYNAAKTAFYVTENVGMGPNAHTNYYDVTADIQAWDPWESYIGAAGAPAGKVVISGSAMADPASQKLTVDGKAAACEAYTVNGSDYYKLRDVAALLNGSLVGFSVDFDVAQRTIYVTTGEDYIPVGGELTAGAGHPAACVASSWTLNVDGEAVPTAVYTVGGNNYFNINDLAAAIGFIADYDAASDTVAIRTDLRAVLHDDGANWVENARYGAYFKEGAAADGIKAIAAAGKLFINGIPVPASEGDLGADGYLVNGSAWLTKVDEGWKVDRNTYDNYSDAVVALLRCVRAGQESLLYDDDGDGYVDRIEATNVAAFIVGKITDNGSGIYTVVREEPAAIAEGEKPYDGNIFTGAGDTVVQMDPALKAGDMALAWYGPDGWVLDKAYEANGILVNGADHQSYQIDDAEYPDAMRFSRDNIIISNRCGELTNAHRYFGFMNNDEGLKVSLWIVPTVDPANSGAPAGYTTGDNAKTFLAKAIEIAKDRLAAADPAASEEVKAACDELSAVIARAEDALANAEYPSLMDYQVYLLYLHLHGSQDDIGAKFAGYDFAGFDNVVGGN